MLEVFLALNPISFFYKYPSTLLPLIYFLKEEENIQKVKILRNWLKLARIFLKDFSVPSHPISVVETSCHLHSIAVMRQTFSISWCKIKPVQCNDTKCHQVKSIKFSPSRSMCSVTSTCFLRSWDRIKTGGKLSWPLSNWSNIHGVTDCFCLLTLYNYCKGLPLILPIVSIYLLSEDSCTIL